MPYGWMGTNLEIDLSQAKFEKKEVDPKLTETYLGGKGTNVKLFWDRVSPEVDPFSPDNLLIFGTGILTGTMAPSANRTCITFKSPMTGLLSYSTFGGFWGTELKQAGYDKIVISGKSPTPVYLWINDDRVEIRDAAHLWGKDTRETRKILIEELKRKEVQTLCIGPAGENKVYLSSIEGSSGASASRAGIGALMGDKKIKAIAVYGTKDINVAKPSELVELSNQILKKTDKMRETFLEHVGPNLVAAEMSYANFGNMETLFPPNIEEETEKIGKDWYGFVKKTGAREIGCYNCNLRCKWSVPVPEGGHAVFKCANWAYPMISGKLLDLTFATRFLGLCLKYGLDAISIEHSIAFAIDLYEKGILTKEDTEGMHLEYGNEEIFLSLSEKIARREGIGDVLANGVYIAARMIGKGAEEYAIHVKKLEPIMIGGFYPILAFKGAISERGDAIRNTSAVSESLAMWPDKEEYMKSEYFHYPEEYKKYFDKVDFEGTAYEGTPRLTAYNEDVYCLGDVTGICYFWLGLYPYPPIKFDTMSSLISYGTGRDIDETEAMKIAHRIGSLVRAYNVRLGLRRKDDSFPKKFFRETPTPPYRTLDYNKFNKMIDEYYKIRGWNSEGIPTKERLDELNLGYVREALERKGIL